MAEDSFVGYTIDYIIDYVMITYHLQHVIFWNTVCGWPALIIMQIHKIWVNFTVKLSYMCVSCVGVL